MPATRLANVDRVNSDVPAADFHGSRRPQPALSRQRVARNLKPSITMSVVDRLTEMLDQRGVAFEVIRHEPVYTSEQAARVRGTSLASGAKALVCKADGQFVMFVIPANHRLASKLVRKNESIRSLRFASRAEVAQLTGLQPGSIPPFGSLFDLQTWCDEALAEQSVINFNAGDHAVSINMSYADYVSIEQPKLGRFTAAEGG